MHEALRAASYSFLEFRPLETADIETLTAQIMNGEVSQASAELSSRYLPISRVDSKKLTEIHGKFIELSLSTNSDARDVIHEEFKALSWMIISADVGATDLSEISDALLKLGSDLRKYDANMSEEVTSMGLKAAGKATKGWMPRMASNSFERLMIHSNMTEKLPGTKHFDVFTLKFTKL